MVRVPRLPTQPPLPPNVYLSRAAHLPWPLGAEQASLHSRARQALWHGIRALGLGEGDEILLPAWQHGSEIEAMRRTGCTPVLYDIDPNTIAPDPDELAASLTDRTRALHLVHYLGWPSDPAGWKKWCDDRGLHLIEDCAQAFLSAPGGIPLGSLGSMAIFCIYKTVGVPDGAVLYCSAPVRFPASTPASGTRAALRGNAEWLLRSWNLVEFVRGPRLTGRSSAGVFDLGDPNMPPTRASSRLMGRLVGSRVAEKRRANFQSLAQRLGGITPQPFRHLPEGATPMVYPVAVEDKPDYLGRIAEKGVLGLNLWSEPHPEIERSEMPGAQWLREHIVGLPVHQELNDRHIEHIGATALDAATRG